MRNHDVEAEFIKMPAQALISAFGPQLVEVVASQFMIFSALAQHRVDNDEQQWGGNSALFRDRYTAQYGKRLPEKTILRAGAAEAD